MTQEPPRSYLATPSPVEGTHRFGHNAMAAPFEILIASEEVGYAGQAAAAAFEEVDRLERLFSKFIDNSDITQINRLTPGNWTKVSADTIECLKVAAKVNKDTFGAFDVTVGPLMTVWRNPDKSLRNPSEEELAAARAKVGMDLVEIDEANLAVRVKVAGMVIDLGGIGKGCAGDRIAEVLRDWDVESALVSAGGSTVLALGAPPGKEGWPSGVGGVGDEPIPPYTIQLKERALSGSGVFVRGSHIMDPRTGRPVQTKPAAWSLCDNGTLADALSTAFIVMSESEVAKYCKQHPDVSAMLAEPDNGKTRLVHFGVWNTSPPIK